MFKSNFYLQLTAYSLSLFLTGCAANIHMQMVRLPDAEHRTRLISPEDIKPSVRLLTVGEKLTYQISWNGIPVGYATLSVEKLEKLNGRDVYVLVSTARSNEFLSKIYRIEDVYRSYLDAEKLYPLKFEKNTKDGRHTSNDVVELDHDNRVAHYTSLKSGEKKDVGITPGIQDIVSCLYYFRTIDFKVGDKLPTKVYVREKSYDLLINVQGYERASINGIGEFYVFKIHPVASFKGIFMSRGNGWILVTTDQRRLPIAAMIKVTPFGSITCVLEKIEGI